MNIANPTCFQRLSRKDFHRLRDAMEATTRETPEFSMSILFPVGKEHHWCDLRVRTLWSDVQPEHYIGAVGQLIDPQPSANKQLPIAANDADATDCVSAILADIRRLETVFLILFGSLIPPPIPCWNWMNRAFFAAQETPAIHFGITAAAPTVFRPEPSPRKRRSTSWNSPIRICTSSSPNICA